MHQEPREKSVVPYIALRVGESPVAKQLDLELRGGPGTWGLAYADEVPDDRDSHDVLWQRYHETRDCAGRVTGAPVAGRVHPGRLRETVSRLTCPVCNHPADKTDDGYLFLVPRAKSRIEAPLTTWPPVCREHATVHARDRPDLRDGYTAIRSADPTLHGVRGRQYRRAGTAFEVARRDARMPYGHAQQRWIVAYRLVRRLTHPTVAIEAADAAR
ncbi:hypothetical protein [Streptomyces rimosus]|uniref:hypothetical protein n=1 Tax=Streptomyces rimosus TaxID=1927 RepID=UPI00067DFA2F|nr:hypothetical protein [Streptomyces rimosus]